MTELLIVIKVVLAFGLAFAVMLLVAWVAVYKLNVPIEVFLEKVNNKMEEVMFND